MLIKNHQGAVLIVSLILLLLMTLLGITAMDSSQLQSQMARNSLQSQTLYQYAFSEIQQQFKALENPDRLKAVTHSNKVILVSAYTGLSIDGVGITITGHEKDNYTLSGAINFIGITAAPPGYSLDLYNTLNYEINIVAAQNHSHSKSDQTQGVSRVIPVNH
ncbi:PilX N-terminal domain-containing pilus assembly protein [Oceanicoccus sagamiensis]|uniref:Type 4 fimbrial biogenesis protein PilX N-terminal domain-containing protein n=1 Tax=Oceanicoccus sagamiensis TaxID=716816 RepID=A0A1X9N8S3_9GAMM|nr:PilX N-terminal domain-containing pilus assembly protein [Oceanicoccus sagamiensis]ARN72842.1 hypothetical protein BST96_01210 [Oceanicoccus sagamiensis]